MRQDAAKMESFLKTHQISVHTKNQSGSEDSLFSWWWSETTIFTKFHYFWPLEGQNYNNGAQSESVVNTYPKSVDTKFELYRVNTISDNSQKIPT